MAHHISWHTEHHLLHIKLEGAITAAEVQTVADEARAIYQDVPGDWRIHMMIDMQKASMAEKAFAYARVSMQASERSGWTIMVGDAKLVGLICSIYTKLTGATFHFAASPAEGIQFLAERDDAIQSVNIPNSEHPQ